MKTSLYAGKPADVINLVDIPSLITSYYSKTPDPEIAEQRIVFGTSGHRGSSFHRSFNENHILAITQAICNYRKAYHVDGPLFLGMDSHALSLPAFTTAMEVLAANEIEVIISENNEFTPTPVISRAILIYNRDHKEDLADGIIITPSHNPPDNGGIKYNPVHGGPAEPAVTDWIQNNANELLENDLRNIKRVSSERALKASSTHYYDYINTYVNDLHSVIDMDSIHESGIRIAVDPMGGAGIHYWGRIADRYRINLTVVNKNIDPTFRFMSLDWDGKIRMDPSSPYVMKRFAESQKDFDIGFACDTDHDRYGIVTPGKGLIEPNQFLTTAIWYLLQKRVQWSDQCSIGKTIVSSQMIDRITSHMNRRLYETPVGFKWFVEDLLKGSICFAGEESAGACFLRRNGSVWTTDKDGIAATLLSAEITAMMNRDPEDIYHELAKKFGHSFYVRMEAPANIEQKSRIEHLSLNQVSIKELAGEKIQAIQTHAPGNGAPIGGVKVIAPNGWFALRPSGTEAVYKIYAESFLEPDHLRRITDEAQHFVKNTLTIPNETIKL